MHHLGSVGVGIQHIMGQLAHGHAHPLADDLPLPVDAAAEVRADPLDDLKGNGVKAFVEVARKGVFRGGFEHLVLNLYDIHHVRHVRFLHFYAFSNILSAPLCLPPAGFRPDPPTGGS